MNKKPYSSVGPGQVLDHFFLSLSQENYLRFFRKSQVILAKSLVDFSQKKSDNSIMIKKIKPHLYLADQHDLCDADTLFIRQGPEELYHICKRAPTSFGGEQYLVGLVKFCYTLGSYHCTRDGCWEKLNLAEVWADPEFTGWEHKA